MNEIEKRISKQKVIARLALEKTRNHFPEAIISGGAPRNWHAGMIAKDVDIFLMQDTEGRLDKIVYDLRKNPDDLIQRKGEPKQSEEITEKLESLAPVTKTVDYCSEDIVEVWELELRGERIQWIFINDHRFDNVQSFIEKTFDFEICKAYFDGFDVVLSDGAKDDFKNKTLTFSLSNVTTHNRLYSLPKRTAKMQNLFPSHRVNILE